ncbi:MAG: AAA family ATPase, partial [Vulcanimicrobiaceae bacterium]
MQPISISIGHFRALRGCTLGLAASTILVGQNGAGKSTVLQALRFFFDATTSASPQDVLYGSDDALSVTVTLADLNPSELASYEEFLDDDLRLTVTKTCTPGDLPSYVARGRKYPGFDSVRECNNQPASAFNTAYKQFVDANPQYGLSKLRSAAECKAELRRWEEAHPDQLVQSDVDFAFEGSTKIQLIPTTRIVYVPAVHRASDDFNSARSPLGQMIDASVTMKLQGQPEIEALQMRWDNDYQELFR